MAPSKPTDFALPWYKRLFRLILILLRYPFKIKKKYDFFIGTVGRMNIKVKDNDLRLLQKRMINMMRLLIMAPLFIGFVINTFVIIRAKDPYDMPNTNKYVAFSLRAFSPLNSKGVIDTIGKSFKRAVLIVKKNPFEPQDFAPFLIGYSLSILGAMFAAKNPLFDKSELIEIYLMDAKLTDINDKPWKVVYTPKYIFFQAYGHNPLNFVEKTTFWNNLGDFQPGEPITFAGDSTIFVIPKKYALPEKIELEFDASLHFKEEAK